MENDVQLDTLETKEVKTYELGYLLSPLVPQDKVEESVETMYQAAIVAKEGSILFRIVPKMRALAYPVSKFINNKRSSFSDAYFGAVKFTAAPTAIAGVKETFTGDGDIIRFLIVSVPKNADRPVVLKRPIGRRVRPTLPKEADGEKGVEMTSEEIDKEIEGLLATTNS
ncbi:MAG: 30S ribosomal protein S6 [Patescibacteria group bacterium]